MRPAMGIKILDEFEQSMVRKPNMVQRQINYLVKIFKIIFDILENKSSFAHSARTLDYYQPAFPIYFIIQVTPEIRSDFRKPPYKQVYEIFHIISFLGQRYEIVFGKTTNDIKIVFGKIILEYFLSFPEIQKSICWVAMAKYSGVFFVNSDF